MMVEITAAVDLVLAKIDSSVAVPGSNYTGIISHYDQAVTQYTSGVLNKAASTAITVLPNFCAGDTTGHLG